MRSAEDHESIEESILRMVALHFSEQVFMIIKNKIIVI